MARKLSEALRQKEQGTLPTGPRLSYGQYLDRWLAEVVKPNLRPRTSESYASLVEIHIMPALGRTAINGLAPHDVQRFLVRKRESGLSASTVKYLYAVVRRSLEQALRWGLVSRNVAAVITPPRIQRQEVQPWTPEQAAAFLKAVRGHRLEALYSVALAVGLRQGEALGLTWADVDLDGGTLSVRRQLQWLDGAPTLVEPKTPRSRRTVALPAFAVEALRAHRARQDQEWADADDAWKGADWNLVFPTLVGTPMDAKNLTHRFQALLKRLGVPRCRFHDLRHACASLLLAQGVSPRVVMETLGHSDYGTTMNIYSHVIPQLQREAADRMDALLAAAGSAGRRCTT